MIFGSGRKGKQGEKREEEKLLHAEVFKETKVTQSGASSEISLLILLEMKAPLRILFFSLLAGPLFSTAQSTRFRHLMADDGLSQNTVNAIAQDSLGFMWFGTGEGLNRYDGTGFRYYRYDPADSNSLSANAIKALVPLGHQLWIGTYGNGVNCLDLVTGRIRHFFHDEKNRNSISGDYVNCMKLIDGLIYIGTDGKGACVLDPGKEEFRALPQVPGTVIRDICADRTGSIWFATSGSGLSRWDPRTGKTETWRADGTKKGILTDRVRTVFADSRGWIWVSHWASGACIIEPATGNVYNTRDTGNVFGKNIPYGLISAYLEDSKGNMWMCTAEDGVVMYNPLTGEKRVLTNDANDAWSISDNTVFCAFEDRSHLLWFGTWRGGLNVYDPKTYAFGWFKKDPKDSMSLSNNYVYSLDQTRLGKIWIGTAQGACILDPSTKKFTRLATSEKDVESLRLKSTVFCVKEDIDSSVWFGTSGGGIYRYFPGTKKWEHYGPVGIPHYFPSVSPSVFLLSNGTLYIGSYYGGLCRYNRATDDFTQYTYDSTDRHSIGGEVISALAGRSDGKIWVGTADGGLNLFDPGTGTFERFLNDPKDTNSLPDNSVSNLCLDHHHKLWIGTASGLCRFDPETKVFTPYAWLNEFLKQEIISIVEDESGDLWVTTRKGLGRLNPSENTLRLYDVSDGLQGNEFFYKAVLHAPGGKIYLGGPNGFNCFTASSITANPSLPTAVITDFTVLNHKYALPLDISYTRDIHLSYRDYFFSFRFAALEYSNTKKNLFRYKLEGFNTSWVEIGNANTVTFTNLDPGEYTLLVQASNNSGTWNETPTSVHVVIDPPFWRTKWFYAMCALTLALMGYSYIRWREKKLLEEKAVLEEKVQQRTTELREEKEKVEAAHKDIKDSITYAKRIQTAILPQDRQFAALLPHSFVLFKPKDIVSGDFYWIAQTSEHVFFVAADCTGHGVPGGFMTMLGTSLLNEIVNEKNITEPAHILGQLREKIIASLRQTGASGESKDGMDMVLCRLHRSGKLLTYAGANNSLYLVRGNALKEFKPDKQPIGFYGDDPRPFTQHDIPLEAGDVIYTFTDGYADQFGGEKGKKFKYKQLEDTLLAIHHEGMQIQKKILEERFEEWKSSYEQVDDVLVIGVKV
jgi:ligand-binding sensor domain-containing protein/serine phosphatase RsbU (regulator of sigma subunit)